MATTEFVYGVQKVHGFTASGYESLTSHFEFVTIVMSAPDITPFAVAALSFADPANPTQAELDAANASQAAFDKLIQIVSERGQPVIMGDVTSTTVVLAIEHPFAWQCTATDTLPSVPSYTDVQPTPPGMPPGTWTPDPRVGEDLASKITADGVNYGLTVASITFSNVLT